MSEKKNIKVKVEEGIKELVIREGSAIPLKEPQKINIHGTINAPSLFWEIRKQDYKTNECHVLYNLRGGFIKLILNEKSAYSGNITGSLEINPVITETFGINQSNTYNSIEDLKKMIRMNRAYFVSKESNMQLVSNLEKFNAKVKQDIDDKSDIRGNYSKSITQEVETNFPLGFELNLPIFVGGSKFKIKCNLAFSIHNGNISIWVESPDLKEHIDVNSEAIIENALISLKKDLVCIEC